MKKRRDLIPPIPWLFVVSARACSNQHLHFCLWCGTSHAFPKFVHPVRHLVPVPAIQGRDATKEEKINVISHPRVFTDDAKTRTKCQPQNAGWWRPKGLFTMPQNWFLRTAYSSNSCALRSYSTSLEKHANAILHGTRAQITRISLFRCGKDDKVLTYRFNHEEEFLDRHLHSIQPWRGLFHFLIFEVICSFQFYHIVVYNVTEPTKWCAPMAPVVKPNGSLRICQGVSQSKIEGGGGRAKRKSSIYNSLVDLNVWYG